MSRAARSSGWPVRTRFATGLPTTRRQAWRTLRQFERVVCQDHFHQEVRLHGPRPAAGVTFDLPHALLGLRVERRGRILTWAEGRGYDFSDLSATDSQRVFPHVFKLRLEPAAAGDDPGTCRLTLEIRGRWTAGYLPAWLVDAWLRWNSWSMGVAVTRIVLADAVDAKRVKATAAAPR